MTNRGINVIVDNRSIHDVKATDLGIEITELCLEITETLIICLQELMLYNSKLK